MTVRRKAAPPMRFDLVAVALFAGLSAVVLAIGLLADPAHDYIPYQNQWQAIIDGGDPWEGTGNAYGPLFNLFAWPYRLHPQLPKLIFLASYLAATGALALRRAAPPARRLVTVILLVGNPLFLVFGMLYGNNDLFLGALLLAAVWTRQNAERASAVAMSLGAGFKLLPLALLPVGALGRSAGLERPKVSWRYVTAAVVTTAVVFGAAGLAWGDGVLDPLITGADRRSKIFSIYRFLRGDYSPLPAIGIESLDGASTYVLVAALVAVYLYVATRRPGPLSSILLVYTVLLTLYPVGHHQFYLPYALVFAFAALGAAREVPNRARYAIAALIWWVGAFALLYHLTSGYADGWATVREWVGLPTFALQVVAIASLVRADPQDAA